MRVTTAYLGFALIAASEGAQADSIAAGTIEGFECGDNCYLTVRTDDGTQLTALCIAPSCAEWNDAGSIPKSLVGRKVSVTISTDNQVDGDGNVVGKFPSFVAIEIRD